MDDDTLKGLVDEYLTENISPVLVASIQANGFKGSKNINIDISELQNFIKESVQDNDEENGSELDMYENPHSDNESDKVRSPIQPTKHHRLIDSDSEETKERNHNAKVSEQAQLLAMFEKNKKKNQSQMSKEELMSIDEEFTVMQIKELIACTELPDDVINNLLAYQVEHVQNLLYSITKHGSAVDLSDPGTGKTHAGAATCASISSILKLKENTRPFLICPKSVLKPWSKVFEIFKIKPRGIVNYEALKTEKFYKNFEDYENDVRTKCPYIQITREPILDKSTGNPVETKGGSPQTKVTNIKWSFPPNTMIIFDEAHGAKNGIASGKQTINSMLMASLKDVFSTEDNITGLILSATITDKIEKLDAVLYVLGMYSPYSKQSYLEYIETLGKEPFKTLNKILFPSHGSRMKKSEPQVKSFFKKSDIKAEAYVLSEKRMKKLEASHDRTAEALKVLNKKIEGDKGNALTVMLRERQEKEILRVNLFVKQATKYLSKKFKVVIFANFIETLDLIEAKLTEKREIDGEMKSIVRKSRIGRITGDQTGTDRDKIIEKFINDELYIVLCTAQAGGMSISLHRGERRIVALHSPPLSAIQLKQQIARIDRANASHDSIQRIIYCKYPENSGKGKCVEEQICQNVNAKLDNIENLNNGDIYGKEINFDIEDLE